MRRSCVLARCNAKMRATDQRPSPPGPEVASNSATLSCIIVTFWRGESSPCGIAPLLSMRLRAERAAETPGESAEPLSSTKKRPALRAGLFVSVRRSCRDCLDEAGLGEGLHEALAVERLHHVACRRRCAWRGRRRPASSSEVRYMMVGCAPPGSARSLVRNFITSPSGICQSTTTQSGISSRHMSIASARVSASLARMFASSRMRPRDLSDRVRIVDDETMLHGTRPRLSPVAAAFSGNLERNSSESAVTPRSRSVLKSPCRAEGKLERRR